MGDELIIMFKKKLSEEMHLLLKLDHFLPTIKDKIADQVKVSERLTSRLDLIEKKLKALEKSLGIVFFKDDYLGKKFMSCNKKK